MTEEQKIKCEEIINYYKEKYEKEFEEINTLGFSIDGEYTSPILRMFGFMPMGLSFFEFQFQTEESYMEWLIFLKKSNYIAGKNIIELAASLSNIFNKNMDKEEAEKLLFVKADIKEELIETYGLPPYHYYATGEFGNIKALYDDLHKNSEDIFKYKYNTTIENIGWAIANYFDNNKENDNNQNGEENKNFNNNENKINNVVENTAKEKIMTEEQKKKCEEIINSYEEKYNKDLEEALSNIRNIPEIPEMPESEIKTVKNYISALLFYYDKSDSKWNITSPLHLEPIPQDKAKAKFYELLAEPKNKTVENIIDLTVSLSEVLCDGITKEEAEKLLFNKKSTEIDGTLSYLNIFTGATEKFIKIMKSHEKGYLEYENYEEEICSIKNIGWAIANYFDKEKIMSNNDELTLNLLILGQTGVGKSSLINALLGKEVAKSGAGKPITTHIKKYETELEGKKINLYDSMGFEVDNEKCITDINDALKERGIDKPIEEWFHSVTYCIQAGGYKIQDFDIKMIKQFTDKKYNVIIALTKAEQINEDKEKEFIEIIKKEIKKDTETDIMVIPISAKPEKLRGMTEAPKPFGLPEYKAAILISWKNIFIDRIPLHIIENLKKDIEEAKSNAPKKGKDLEKLAKEIQEYFSNVLKEKLQGYVEENFKKYYKITEDILTVSKNIDISNLNLDISIFRFADVFHILAGLVAMGVIGPIGILLGLIQLIAFHINKSKKIDEFINEISQKIIDKISEKEFESEIRKIIIETLNEIDKKIIKLN